MQPNSSVARVRVTLLDDIDVLPNYTFLFETLEGLTMAGVWAALAFPVRDMPEFSSLRALLEKEIRNEKAKARFYPGFYRNELTKFETMIFPQDFELLDPLDAGLISGMNSWLRRAVYQVDSRLYGQVFSFAQTRSIRRRSPLIVELALYVGLGVFGPPVLALICARAAENLRRARAEANMRETEAQLKYEELKQQKSRTIVLEAIAEAVQQVGLSGKVPDQVIEAMVKMGGPAIADLGASPLIGNITVGFPTASR